ncbi:MAG: F0F1 ATP synthase subunit A [Anaerovoracaceae bacterium]|jgi:F-type H+-transporting ATPase subunit a
MEIQLNHGTAFTLELFDKTIAVSQSIVIQWIVMAIIIILALIMTRKLTIIPTKGQTVIEMIVEFLNGLVETDMGDEHKKAFGPFIGTMAIFMLILNLTGLIGVAPATMDINVTLSFALVSFFAINGYAIKYCHLGNYLHSYLQPYPAMLPMNVLEKFTVIISLTLRLAINMLAGVILLHLVYYAMGYFAFIVPVPLHLFFDLFVPVIQTYVFIKLTMVNTKMALGH